MKKNNLLSSNMWQTSVKPKYLSVYFDKNKQKTLRSASMKAGILMQKITKIILIYQNNTWLIFLYLFN